MMDVQNSEKPGKNIDDYETKYRIVADNTYDWEFWLGPEGQYVYVSPSSKRITGYDAEEFLSDSNLLFRIIYPEDLHNFKIHESNVEKQYEMGEIEFRIICKDGRIRWISHACRPIFDQKGSYLGVRGSNRDITERKDAEEAVHRAKEELEIRVQERTAELKEREERFRLIAETIEDVFWMSTPGIGKMLFISPAYEQIWGKNRESLYRSPKSFLEAIHPDDQERLRNAVDDHAHGLWNHEYRICRPDGSVRWIQDRGFPIYDDQGKLRLMTGVAKDITDHKKMVELLQNRNELLESVFSNIHFLLAYMDTNFNFLRVNRAYAKADGRDPDFFIGKNHFDLFPNEENKAIFCQVVETGEPFQVSEKAFKYAEFPDRGITYWDWSLYPVKDPKGSVVGLVLSLVDVTERKQAEDKLRFNEWKYRNVYESVPVSIFEEDFSQVKLALKELNLKGVQEARKYLEGNPEFLRKAIHLAEVIDMNQHALKMFEANDKKELKESLNRVFLPEFLETFKELLIADVEGRPNFESETTVQTLRKKKKDILINVSFPDQDSDFLNALMCLVDISELKRTQEELQASQELLDKTFSSLEEAVFVVDASDRTIVTCNPAVKRIFGYETDEVIGRNTKFLHVNHDMYEDFGEALFRSLDINGSYHVEFQMKRKGGSIFFTEHTATQIFDHAGNRSAIVSAVRDITQRKKAQEALIKANKELEMLKERLYEENIYLQEEIRLNQNFENIIGESNAIKRVFAQVEQVSSTDATVLILGETGTGKELLARALHANSRRKHQPLIKIDCAAIPPTLIESEFFGHEKGAFTGAIKSRVGRIALADEGTIFLDEIGELPKDIQSKLLRVLQEGEFEPVGSSKTQKVDIRVIAATNRDLWKAVQDGSFRLDLYYRLSVFPIKVPSLRDRREDIPLLSSFFTQHFAQKINKKIESLSQESIRQLVAYDWPGNVRELQNVIERAVITSREGRLALEPMMPSRESKPMIDTKKSQKLSYEGPILTTEEMQQLERENLIRALKTAGWRISGKNGAAFLLGMPPSTLSSRIKALGIKRPK
jgi:PAS domain S-box-containing protein